jgi:hypothetical protein
MKLLSSLFVLLATLSLNAYEPCSDYSEPCCNENSYKIGFEWLFWKAEQEKLSCGVSFNVPQGREDAVVNAKFLQPHFKYKNGYRVSLAKTLPCTDWEFKAVYAYVPGSGNFKAGNAENYEFVALKTFNFLPLSFFEEDQFNSAKGNWNQNYHVLDLDLGKAFNCASCFSFRPHAGFRILWLKENYSLNATGNGYKDVGTSGANVFMKQDMKAFGMEAGIYGSWDIGCNCAIIGHLGGAVLYSKYSTHYKMQQYDSNSEEDFALLKTKSSSRFGTLMGDYSIGFQWIGCVCSMPLTARVSWEQQVILDTNRWSEGGNLSLQGITLGLEASF